MIVSFLLYVVIVNLAAAASRTSSGDGRHTRKGEIPFSYSLADPPIQGDAILYLDNNREYGNSSSIHNNPWKLYIPNHDNDATIPARVPGDLVSDLVSANILPEPYYENNFESTYICDDTTTHGITIWTYTIEVDTSSLLADDSSSNSTILLVLDGIKMGARIIWNDIEVGITTDQFLRYQFPVTPLSNNNNNNTITNKSTLRIQLDSSIESDGRFMPCSGGWDWAPFTKCPKTVDTQSTYYTRGITKSVYLTKVSSAAITAIVPQTFYRGANYPTTALVDGQHDGFEVRVKIHLWSPINVRIKGTIQVYGSWALDDTTTATTATTTATTATTNIAAQEVEWNGGDTIVTVSIMAEAKDIKLWWPNGLGTNPRELAKRPMYDVHVQFVPDTTTKAVIQDSRRIGFRHFALVTGNDTDSGYVANATGQEGTDFHGMYFRINGVGMYSRGANMIPMDELEGRLTTQGHVQLVQSAVLANMNTLRVWGGGMFLPSAWYDACDDYGILVIQDQMYAQGGHVPKETKTQELEIRHNIRLLSNHPSIVIWDGCNECTVDMDNKATSIFATFVMRLVAEEDGSRSIWPSCPANGWSSGVEKLTCRPIPGKPLITPKQVPRRIETHGPYVHGGGEFPAVNGNDHEPVDPKLPILLDSIPKGEMGMGYPNVFVSEFGVGGVMSSFESMSATLQSNHWSLHGGSPPDNCTNGFNRQCTGGNVMAQRNYPCDSIIQAYFAMEGDYFDKVGVDSFQRQLYHCMIGQALQMKSIMEERRSKNELGHLVWQLNEIWPTGGWGSLEYGSNSNMDGQVVGGRWKPLHYFYRQSTFVDVLATCGGNGVGYIRNDGPFAFHGAVVVHTIHLETGEVDEQKMTHSNITLSAGPGSLQVLECPIVDGRTHFLSTDVYMYRKDLIIRNSPILLAPPKDFTNRIWCDSGLEFTILGESMNVVSIEIIATVPVALLVVLTTEAPGRFSENAFTILGGSKIVTFHPTMNGNEDDVDVKEWLETTLRIEDMAMYQPKDQCRETETEAT